MRTPTSFCAATRGTQARRFIVPKWSWAMLFLSCAVGTLGGCREMAGKKKNKSPSALKSKDKDAKEKDPAPSDIKSKDAKKAAGVEPSGS